MTKHCANCHRGAVFHSSVWTPVSVEPLRPQECLKPTEELDFSWNRHVLSLDESRSHGSTDFFFFSFFLLCFSQDASDLQCGCGAAGSQHAGSGFPAGQTDGLWSSGLLPPGSRFFPGQRGRVSLRRGLRSGHGPAGSGREDPQGADLCCRLLPPG